MAKEFTPEEYNTKISDIMDVLDRAKSRAKAIELSYQPSPAYAAPWNGAVAYGAPLEKEEFDIVIIDYNKSKLIAALKELRRIFTNIGIMEAKEKLNAPIVAYTNVYESMARNIKEELQKIGFTVELR
jgi:ribosomal protein L7/L12